MANRTFTLIQARELLPVLEGLLRGVQEKKQRIEEIDQKFQEVNSRILLHGGLLVDIAPFAELRGAALAGACACVPLELRRRVPVNAGWNESALIGTTRAFAAFCTSMVALAVMPGSSQRAHKKTGLLPLRTACRLISQNHG